MSTTYNVYIVEKSSFASVIKEKFDSNSIKTPPDFLDHLSFPIKYSNLTTQQVIDIENHIVDIIVNSNSFKPCASDIGGDDIDEIYENAKVTDGELLKDISHTGKGINISAIMWTIGIVLFLGLFWSIPFLIEYFQLPKGPHTAENGPVPIYIVGALLSLFGGFVLYSKWKDSDGALQLALINYFEGSRGLDIIESAKKSGINIEGFTEADNGLLIVSC